MLQPKGDGLPSLASGTPMIQITCSDCGQVQKRTTTKIASDQEGPAIKLVPDVEEVFVCGCGTRPV